MASVGTGVYQPMLKRVKEHEATLLLRMQIERGSLPRVHSAPISTIGGLGRCVRRERPASAYFACTSQGDTSEQP